MTDRLRAAAASALSVWLRAAPQSHPLTQSVQRALLAVSETEGLGAVWVASGAVSAVNNWIPRPAWVAGELYLVLLPVANLARAMMEESDE